MSGLLIFAGSKEAISRIAEERNAFQAQSPADLRGMLDILNMGGVAVASIYELNTGYRIPDGCDIEFDESCPEAGPERLQAEGRKLRLYPHQEKLISEMRERVGDTVVAQYNQNIGRTHRAGGPVQVQYLKPGDPAIDQRLLEQLDRKSVAVHSPFDGNAVKRTIEMPELD